MLEEKTKERIDECKLKKYLEAQECNMNKNKQQNGQNNVIGLNRNKSENNYSALAQQKKENDIR